MLHRKQKDAQYDQFLQKAGRNVKSMGCTVWPITMGADGKHSLIVNKLLIAERKALVSGRMEAVG